MKSLWALGLSLVCLGSCNKPPDSSQVHATADPVAPAHVQRVAYSDGKQIFVIGIDGSNKRQLTKGPEDYDATWSPDGKYLAFTRVERHTPNEVMSDADIWVVTSDGTGEKQLTTGPDYDGEPVWSADGQAVTFQRQGKAPGRYEIRLDKPGSIMRSGPWNQPVFSKDGRWWAATVPVTKSEDEHQSAVWLGKAGDRRGRPVPGLTGEVYEPVWSPIESAFVVFVQRPGNPSRNVLYRVDSKSGSTHVLDSGPNVYLESPLWSPNGKRIAFVKSISESPMTNASFRQLYAMDADGKNIRRLTDHWCDDFTPQWTRDGKRIILQGERGMTNHPGSGVSGSPTSYVVVVMADGSGEQILQETGGAYGIALEP